MNGCQLGIFKNDGGKLIKSTEAAGLAESNGWWNAIVGADLDQDGDTDFVVGNHGLNSRFKASKEKPVMMYTNDFDRNGSAEQILTVYNDSSAYPLVLKHDLVMQMPSLKKKYLKYASYQEQTINDIFLPEQLEKAVQSSVYELATSIIINQGNGKFMLKRLPTEAQFSPTYGISVADFDNDQIPDIVLGGNLYAAKPEVGIYDASQGMYLKGLGNGQFVQVATERSGLLFSGEIRDLVLVEVKGKVQLWAVRNNNSPQIFTIQPLTGVTF